MLKIFCICLFYPTVIFAANSGASKVRKEIPVHQILSNYQKRSSVTMEVTKTLTQPVLKRKTQSQGKFYFMNKLWRFETVSPHPSVIFYDGEKVTSAANNVLHHTPSGNEMILSTLLNPEAFYKKFTYQGAHQKGRTQIYSFTGNPPAPQKVFIQVEKDRILSLRIHWDSASGEEFYRFRSIQFDQKLDKKLFKEP